MGRTVHLLDTVSGNIRSLVNAIEKLGFEVQWIRNQEDFVRAEVSSHRILLFISSSMNLQELTGKLPLIPSSRG